MNRRDLATERNNTARMVRWSNRSGGHRGCIRFSTAEGFKHFLAKCLKCWELAIDKKEFLTECIYSDGSRGDILCLDNKIDYEVLSTEEPYMAETKKVGRYPLDVEMVDADVEVKKWVKLLEDLKSVEL